MATHIIYYSVSLCIEDFTPKFQEYEVTDKSHDSGFPVSYWTFHCLKSLHPSEI